MRTKQFRTGEQVIMEAVVIEGVITGKDSDCYEMRPIGQKFLGFRVEDDEVRLYGIPERRLSPLVPDEWPPVPGDLWEAKVTGRRYVAVRHGQAQVSLIPLEAREDMIGEAFSAPVADDLHDSQGTRFLDLQAWLVHRERR